jgi:hypothetical protein
VFATNRNFTSGVLVAFIFINTDQLVRAGIFSALASEVTLAVYLFRALNFPVGVKRYEYTKCGNSFRLDGMGNHSRKLVDDITCLCCLAFLE